MTQLIPTLILVALVVVLFLGMWFAWRKRGKRDAHTLPTRALTGHELAHFPRVFYVATTLQGEPLERISVPGLKYRGYASLVVKSDGCQIQVIGEDAVGIPATQISGVSTAQMRIDKVVEHSGLTLITWQVGERVLETSFRMPDNADQRQLSQAVEEMLAAPQATRSSQEG